MKKINVKYNTDYNDNTLPITSRNFLHQRQNKVNQMNGLVEDFQLSYEMTLIIQSVHDSMFASSAPDFLSIYPATHPQYIKVDCGMKKNDTVLNSQFEV